ncbi:MAG: phosphatidate cytidylyltransferase [Thermogutta sp.]|nr:phosphatidate cytidylyltransferase [Thermogutta sp.]
MATLLKRLVFGTLLAAILLILCWFDDRAVNVPGIFLLPVLLAFVLLGGNEIIFLCRENRVFPFPGVVHLGNVLTVGTAWGMGLFWLHWETTHPDRLARAWDLAAVSSLATLVAVAVTVFLAFVVEMQRYRSPGGATVNIAGAVFAVCYIGVLAGFLVQLRVAFGLDALVSLLMVVKLGDTGAFAVGRMFGTHRLAPRLSPGKTLEGALGAILFGVLGGFISFHWLLPQLGLKTGIPHWLPMLAYGVVLAVVGMIGDLAESLIKRDARQKDSSHLVPGLGGALDLIDSALMAAPAAYVFWLFGWLN